MLPLETSTVSKASVGVNNRQGRVMSSNLVIAGLALAAIGYGGRYLLRHSKTFARVIPKELPSFNVSIASDVSHMCSNRIMNVAV